MADLLHIAYQREIAQRERIARFLDEHPELDGRELPGYALAELSELAYPGDCRKAV